MRTFLSRIPKNISLAVLPRFLQKAHVTKLTELNFCVFSV